MKNIEFEFCSDYPIKALASMNSIIQSEITGKMSIITDNNELFLNDAFQILNEISWK